MERGNLLLANNMNIGLSFGFFTMMIKNFAWPKNLTEMGGGEKGQIFLWPINNMGEERRI
jgi:hypothetical protein